MLLIAAVCTNVSVLTAAARAGVTTAVAGAGTCSGMARAGTARTARPAAITMCRIDVSSCAAWHGHAWAGPGAQGRNTNGLQRSAGFQDAPNALSPALRPGTDRVISSPSLIALLIEPAAASNAASLVR